MSIINLKKIFFYLRLLFFAKWTFFKPKKNNLMIFDKGNSILLKKILRKKLYVLDTKYENINLFVFIKTLKMLKFKRFYYLYLINFIKIVDPKIIISAVDTSSFFLELKSNFPEKTLILIQSSKRSNYSNDFLNNLSKMKNRKKYNIDYFFLMNSSIIPLYKKYINSKFIVHGSLKNNYVPISKSVKKKYALISQISDYKDKSFKSKSNKTVFVNNLFENGTERLIANFIKTFPDEDLNIIPYNMNNEANFNYEKKYYMKIQKKYNFKINLLNKNKSLDAYKLVDRFELLIGLNSTLLCEALGRNKKIISFNTFEEYKINGYQFGWPIKNLSETEISSDHLNPKIFSKKIINLAKIKNVEWQYLRYKYKNKIMFYDNNNLKLINLFNNLLKSYEI